MSEDGLISPTKEPHNIDDEDTEFLTKLGYNQSLYRSLNTFQNFSFGFVQVQCLGAITTLSYAYGITIGGPAVFIWSFLGSYFFSIFVAFSLAEVCSAFPTAGSVYNWTAQLAPDEHVPIASYICGMANFVGNVGSNALQAFAFSHYLNALVAAR